MFTSVDSWLPGPPKWMLSQEVNESFIQKYLLLMPSTCLPSRPINLNAIGEHRLDSVYGTPHRTQQCLLSSDLGDGDKFSKYNPQKADCPGETKTTTEERSRRGRWGRTSVLQEIHQTIQGKVHSWGQNNWMPSIKYRLGSFTLAIH